MRTPTCLCLLLICMLISCTPTQEKHEIDYTSYVNPFIGTDFKDSKTIAGRDTIGGRWQSYCMDRWQKNQRIL